MEETDRPQRSDAARNRQRLLAAAAEVFAERGLEAGVGEIAQRAGVGRGTLFRNFPTKRDLIAAIVVERVHQVIADAHAMMATGDPAEVPFVFLGEIIRRQQQDRSLFEAIADEFLENPDIRAMHGEFIALIEELLERGRDAGSVRPGVGAMDVMMLTKGACAAAAALEASPELLERHIDLLRAAICTPEYVVPLSGRTPTLADVEAGFTPPSVAPAA